MEGNSLVSFFTPGSQNKRRVPKVGFFSTPPLPSLLPKEQRMKEKRKVEKEEKEKKDKDKTNKEKEKNKNKKKRKKGASR